MNNQLRGAWVATRLRVWTVAFVGLLWAWHAVAMNMEIRENTIFLSGGVDGTEWNKLRDVLGGQRIERIVFVNSPGGDLWTGMRVGRLIAEHKLQTVVVGSCISSCSIMFMGGSDRRFADTYAPSLTYVGIHGPHNKFTKQVDTSQAGQIYAFFAQRMGDKFNAELMKAALYEMDDAGALLYVYDPKRSPAKAPMHCRSLQTASSACTKLAGNNAVSIGLVTTDELVNVTLPVSMQEQLRIPGGVLTGATVDEGRLAELSQLVSTQAGRDAVVGFGAKSVQRALAFPLEGKGAGSAWGYDTTAKAYLTALYNCNHVKDRKPRLCEVKVVNELDVSGNAAISADEHAKALAALTVPRERFYGNEQFGGGFVRFAELRTEKFSDTTPQELPQVKTIATQALATVLLEKERPVVVDISLADATIPTAVPLAYGGHAWAEPTKDTDLANRIAGLLQLISPDAKRLLVFVGYDKDDWRAVNAAVRATRAGYENVAWYRGGLTAWRAANLPTARAHVQAIAN